MNYVRRDIGGFTLIEILVAVGIISLLSSVVLVNINSSRLAANDAIKMSDLNQISKALEIYYLDKNQYPGLGAKSSLADVLQTEEYCATQPEPKIGWCKLREDLAPYIKLPMPPDKGYAVHTINGVTYYHEIAYFYFSDPVTNFQKYALMVFLRSSSNLNVMANDGGAYNVATSAIMPTYEIGELAKYCGSKYSGLDADWWAFSHTTTCRGGN